MEKAIKEADLLPLIEKAKQLIASREKKIAAIIEEIKKYPRIFLYGAGKYAEISADLLKDAFEGKEIAFIDKDERKHGLEIFPNIFCRPIQAMYGFGDKAVIIVTSVKFANQIEYELTREFYQNEDKLLNTPINTELVFLAHNNKELYSNLKKCVQGYGITN